MPPLQLTFTVVVDVLNASGSDTIAIAVVVQPLPSVIVTEYMVPPKNIEDEPVSPVAVDVVCPSDHK